MTPITYVAAIFAFIAMMPHSLAYASNCFDPTIARGESRSILGISTKIPGPYFYFRSFDYDFAIIVRPSDFRSELESAASRGNTEARALLALMAKDLPLWQNTDLFRYVLADYYNLSVIQRTLVDLMARRDAAVFDAETGELVPTIEMKRENSVDSRGRTFLGPNNKILMQTIDCVEN